MSDSLAGEWGWSEWRPTWTRALIYHPHVHYIVTGGGLSASGKWKSSREDFLVPVRALSVIFRAKFRDFLKKTELFDQVDARVWKKEWVVHSEPVGRWAGSVQVSGPLRVSSGDLKQSNREA